MTPAQYPPSASRIPRSSTRTSSSRAPGPNSSAIAASTIEPNSAAYSARIASLSVAAGAGLGFAGGGEAAGLGGSAGLGEGVGAGACTVSPLDSGVGAEPEPPERSHPPRATATNSRTAAVARRALIDAERSTHRESLSRRQVGGTQWTRPASSDHGQTGGGRAAGQPVRGRAIDTRSQARQPAELSARTPAGRTPDGAGPGQARGDPTRAPTRSGGAGGVASTRPFCAARTGPGCWRGASPPAAAPARCSTHRSPPTDPARQPQPQPPRAEAHRSSQPGSPDAVQTAPCSDQPSKPPGRRAVPAQHHSLHTGRNQRQRTGFNPTSTQRRTLRPRPAHRPPETPSAPSYDPSPRCAPTAGHQPAQPHTAPHQPQTDPHPQTPQPPRNNMSAQTYH